MRSFVHSFILPVCLTAIFSCQSIPTVTKNEINSVNELSTELKEEIKSDARQGKPVDYRKKAIVEKLENYSVTLTDKSKQDEQLKSEKELADKYRMIRNIAIILGIIGAGILIYRFRDFIPGFPKLPF